MARWYSKQCKEKYSFDLKRYGCIPAYAKIVQSARAPHYSKGGLDLCTFDDDCDFCKTPKKGTYVSMSGYEQPEADFYICGKCAVRSHKKGFIDNQAMCAGYSNFSQWKRKQRLLEGQFICAWCDSTSTGKCSCSGAKYSIEHDGLEYYEMNKAS